MTFNFIGNYSVIISLFLSFAIFFRTIFRLKNLNELIKIDLKKLIFFQFFFILVSFILPALIIFLSLKNIDVYKYDNLHPYLILIKRVAGFIVIIYSPILLNKILTSITLTYKNNHFFIRYPINTYLQLLKLVIIIVSLVLASCYLLNTSPWGVLSGIGALGAILLLVFKDTILGLVASIQVYGGNLIKEGDWIELKNLDIDGEVLEVGLHRVKVKAWDNSITTFPTSKLLELTFKNWRNMKESGGRRIKRNITIKTSSIKFIDEKMLKKVSSINLLKDYIENKLIEISADPHKQSVNRKLTNIGCFRVYIKKYLENNKNINKSMTLMVRQKPPNQFGLPIEIYAFTSTTEWKKYENIQSDIFDHILASTKLFELSVYQSPSSYDLNNFLGTNK